MSIILLMGLGSTSLSHANGEQDFIYKTADAETSLSSEPLSGFNGRRIPLVKIEAESYPDVTYEMGFDLDGSGNRTGIFYQDPSLAAQDQYKDYSLTDLEAAPRTMVTATGLGKVFNVVQIAYSNNVITILFQPNVLKGKFLTKKFTVDCAGGEANCIAHDGDTGKATNFIYMYKNTSWGKTVGVSSIESR